MHLWNENRFAEIGNYLGEYICADLSFLETGKYLVAKILVKIDTCMGLSSEITVQSKDGDFVQILDYVGVPFRCHRCHTYGHLMAKCSLPFRAHKPLFEEGLEASKEVGAAAAVGVRNNEPVEDREMDSIPVV